MVWTDRRRHDSELVWSPCLLEMKLNSWVGMQQPCRLRMSNCQPFFPSRSKPRGCASARKAWYRSWSRISSSLCSSRVLWTSGLVGWIMLLLKSWSITRAVPASPRQPGSSCWNGLSIGTFSFSFWRYFCIGLRACKQLLEKPRPSSLLPCNSG